MSIAAFIRPAFGLLALSLVAASAAMATPSPAAAAPAADGPQILAADTYKDNAGYGGSSRPDLDDNGAGSDRGYQSGHFPYGRPG